MYELRLKPVLALKGIVCIDNVSLHKLDFTTSVGEVDKALVAELELHLIDALVLVRDQIGLSERGVRLKTELRGGHHRAEEGLGGSRPPWT